MLHQNVCRYLSATSAFGSQAIPAASGDEGLGHGSGGRGHLYATQPWEWSPMRNQTQVIMCVTKMATKRVDVSAAEAPRPGRSYAYFLTRRFSRATRSSLASRTSRSTLNT